MVLSYVEIHSWMFQQKSRPEAIDICLACSCAAIPAAEVGSRAAPGFEDCVSRQRPARVCPIG